MAWFVNALRSSPELAMFLAVALGYWIGNLKFGTFSLGTVTGSLIAGLVIGQLDVEMNRELRWALFLLFLFANGYSVGPQFLAALKRDGARPMLLSLTIAVTGLASAWLMARLLKLDPGLSAGLFAGSLTQSAAIGTATDAVMALPLPEEQRKVLANHIAVADALTYVVGALSTIWFVSILAPKLLRIDLAPAAQALEAQFGIKAQTLGIISGAQKFALRAYRVEAGPWAGQPVRTIEADAHGRRYFVERVRRGDRVFEAEPDTVLQVDDTVVVYGRFEALVAIGPQIGPEAHDPDLTDIPVQMLEVVVTNRRVCGRALEELVGTAEFDLRSVGLRRLVRGAQEIPFGAMTVLNPGDVVELVGPQRAVERVAADIGYALQPSNATHLARMGFGILIGALIGLPYLMIGNVKLTLSVSVGALLAGLVFGWLRSVRPTMGTIPAPTLQFMIDFGLAAFVAGAGLQAGPEFVHAVQEFGLSIVLAGFVVALVPMSAALAVGHYVLKMNAVLLLGGLSGGMTFTGALAALQEKAKSRVPVLGYTVPYATSNVLLTTCGSLIVALAA
jgi:putative transport protein